jgi:hypothetical protein
MKSTLLFGAGTVLAPVFHECSRGRGKQPGNVTVPESDGPGSVAALAPVVGVAVLIFNRYRK